MNLKPLGDHLVVKAIEQDDYTTSGIFLPETAKEKPQQGMVLAVGPGKQGKENGRLPMDIHVDDRILFARYVGTNIKLRDGEFLILRESDVLAVVEN